jgi:hypothetical protein
MKLPISFHIQWAPQFVCLVMKMRIQFFRCPPLWESEGLQSPKHLQSFFQHTHHTDLYMLILRSFLLNIIQIYQCWFIVPFYHIYHRDLSMLVYSPFFNLCNDRSIKYWFSPFFKHIYCSPSLSYSM